MIMNKPRKNLKEMIDQLDGVEIGINDIEQLALQILLESDKSFDKVNALKVLVDVKKHLSSDGNEKELINILRGDKDE